jgi:hypothetical protein
MKARGGLIIAHANTVNTCISKSKLADVTHGNIDGNSILCIPPFLLSTLASVALRALPPKMVCSCSGFDSSSQKPTPTRSEGKAQVIPFTGAILHSTLTFMRASSHR